jgi:NAD(P)H-dependent FMN reductase
MRVEIISGSARQGSQTKRIALHLHDELKNSHDIEVDVIDLAINNFPPVQTVFTSPLDAPLELRDIANRMFEADAFLLVSPEYNGSYSPAMKNFLDHFPKQSKKAFGIVTGSPGALGGIRAAIQLQNLTFGLMGIGSPQMLIVPELDKKFRSDGLLVDQNFKESVTSFIDSFLWLSRAITYSKAENIIKKSA